MAVFDPTKYGAKILNTPSASGGVGGGTPVNQFGAKIISSQQPIPQPPPPPKEETYGAFFPATGRETALEGGLKAAGNLPSSAFNLASGIYGAIRHPIQTAKGIVGTGVGLAEKLIPGQQPQEEYANAVGGFLKNRFGSLEAAQKTAVNDPFGFASDILTLVGAGAGAIGKTGELGKLTSAIAKPITKPASVVAGLGAKAAKEIATGSVGAATGVGKEALSRALSVEGAGEAFTAGLRNKINLTDVLGEAQAGLGEVKKIRGATYETTMNNLKVANPQSLELTPVLEKARELAKTFNIKQAPDGSLDLSRSALVNDKAKVEGIFNLLDEWGTQAGDRTVAGIDLLKRQIRDFREPTNPTLNKFVDDLSRSAKEVAAKVPGYEDIQKTYGNYSDFISELEKTLSLKESATPDQAITKLNSLLRDNADYRRVLADELKQVTGKDIISPIAGKALSKVTPQGLAKYVALGAGYTIPSIIPYLAISSPRLMGEFFRAAGITGRAAYSILDDINHLRVSAGLQTIKAKLPEGMQDYLKNPKLGLSIEDVSKNAYKGEKDLTTKILKDLEGKTTVSKQYILDATNRGELKQVERDLIRQTLATEKGDTINVSDFAKKVKAELLPLKIKNETFPATDKYKARYENITLPDELRGAVKNYKENIYESPIKTSAGYTHFDNWYGSKSPENYFGHTRIEDMADNKTRRVIEVQSDLYQKGRLEDEIAKRQAFGGKNVMQSKTGKELSKLQQYNDPTAHFRMIREEIKKASQDGKTKLQFPTGETAMKIEGLGTGDANRWIDEVTENQLHPDKLKVGQSIMEEGEYDSKWIITDVLGDGKFKAVPKRKLEEIYPSLDGFKITDSSRAYIKRELGQDLDSLTEQFDISGKVDTSNPIYKFYEKDVQKYLNKFGGRRIKDAQGVEWIEVPIKKEWGKMPVEAFAMIGAVGAGTALAGSKK